MRVLVTGGAGFIGSHVAQTYRDLGHEVAIVDDLSTGRRANVPSGVRLHELGLTDPRLGEVVERERPEVVSHHAAQKDVRKSVDDPILDARTNVLGMIALLEACVRARVRKVVFASSGGVIYGEQEHFPADEDHPKRPVSPYGITKLAGEHLLAVYRRLHGLRWLALRYANVFGPRQDPHGEAGVVAIFALKSLRGEGVVVNGDGEQTRDYVYVEDVVRANVAALAEEPEGAVNIGTGVETSVNEIARQVGAAAGSKLPPRHAPPRPGEQRRSVLDVRRARSLLGWEPTFSLAEGVRRTVASFR